MSAALSSSQRLRRLEQILADSGARRPVVSGDGDAAALHLEHVPLERIRRLAELLETGRDADDAVDALVMRLLLNDYTTAVADLRAVSRTAGHRLDAACGPVNDLRRVLWQHDKLRDTVCRTTAGKTVDDETSGDETSEDTRPPDGPER